MAVAAAAAAGALRFSLSALLADVLDDLLGASKTALCENTRNYIRISLEFHSSRNLHVQLNVERTMRIIWIIFAILILAVG